MRNYFAVVHLLIRDTIELKVCAGTSGCSPAGTQIQEAGVRFLARKLIQIPSGKTLVLEPAELCEPIMNLCVNLNSEAAFHGRCPRFCSPGTPDWRLVRVGLGLNWLLTVCLRVSPLPSAAGGEIFDHCVSDELLPETQITRLIRQTLEGVHQLHQNNLVHLDLKVCAHRTVPRCSEEPLNPGRKHDFGCVSVSGFSLCSSLSHRTSSSPAFRLSGTSRS